MKSSVKSVAAYFPLAESAVRAVSSRLPYHVAREDLVSAARLAIARCVSTSGVGMVDRDLRALCFVRARGAALEELRRMDPLPRGARRRVRLVKQAVEVLTSRLGRSPSDLEVSESTGLEIELVERAMGAIRFAENGPPAAWDIADDQSSEPSAAVEREDMRVVVARALSRLPRRHARVLKLYYIEDRSLEDIGRIMRCSHESVRLLRNAALEHLKADFFALGVLSAIVQQKR